MTLMKVAELVTKLEGGKSSAKVGDVKQALKLLCMLEAAYRIKATEKFNTKCANGLAMLSVETEVFEALNAEIAKAIKKWEKSYGKKQKEKGKK